jgi:hypothetical protein
MGKPPDIREALKAEYARLHKLWAEQRVASETASRLIPDLDARIAAVSAALNAYGAKEEGCHTPDSQIAQDYTLGRPTKTIAGDLADDHELKWTEADVEIRARELGLTRPPGWDAVRAENEWDNASLDNDDWIEAIYGLPPSAMILDDTSSEPRLLLSAPVENPLVGSIEVVKAADIVAVAAVVPPSGYKSAYHARRAERSSHDPRVSAFLASRWTAERIALLERDWPTFTIVEDIATRLNELPGDPIEKGHVSSFANSILKLKRPPDFLNEMRRRAGNESAGWATEERKNLLRQHWPSDGVSLALRRKMAALPGSPLPTSGVINSYATSALFLERKKSRGAERTAVRAEQQARQKAVMEDMWPRGVQDEEIVAALRAVGSRVMVRDLPYYARTLGLSRPAVEHEPTSQIITSESVQKESTEIVATPETETIPSPPASVKTNGKAIEPELLADAARLLDYPFDAPKSPTLAELATRKEPYKPPPKPVPAPRPNLGPPRLAKALELPPPLPASHELIKADAATIRATADLWGVVFRGRVDLWAVNKAAEKRGARPFELVDTIDKPKRRQCLSCTAWFDSNGPHQRMCDHCAERETGVTSTGAVRASRSSAVRTTT